MVRFQAAEHLQKLCLLSLPLPRAAICRLLVALTVEASALGSPVATPFQLPASLPGPCLQSTACRPPQLWATAQSCGM